MSECRRIADDGVCCEWFACLRTGQEGRFVKPFKHLDREDVSACACSFHFLPDTHLLDHVLLRANITVCQGLKAGQQAWVCASTEVNSAVAVLFATMPSMRTYS